MIQEINKIPKLRFPLFKEEWKVKKLSHFGEFKNGLNKSKSDFGFGMPFINLMDVFGKPTVTKSEFELVNANSKELELYNLNKGDVLFIRSSVKREGVGEASVILEDLPQTVYSGFLIRYRTTKKLLVTGFKRYCFSTRSLRKQILSLSTTSANTNINQESLNQIVLFYPSIEEQKKIALFLRSIDYRIEKLKRKKNLLKEYRKGVLQKIFSQEIRFKDSGGDNYSDWKLKKLGELTYKVGKKNKENIQYPIYSINNKEGFLPQSDQFEGVDSNARGYDISLYKIINTNTFAYNPARINVGSIGYSGELNNVIISSLYVCFKTKDELSDHFLLAFLDTYEFKKAVLRNAEGGVRSYLFYDNFSIIKIPLPSLEEQKKIVEFLTVIDDKISLVEQQIEKTEAYKKGLLQQMFV